MKDDFSIKGEVIDALQTVTEERSGKNLVDGHFAESVDVNGGVVEITLVIERDYPREQRFALEDKIYDKVEAIAGVNEVKVKPMTPDALERQQAGAGAATSAPAPAPKAAAGGTSAPAPSAGASPAPGSRAPTMPASAPVEGVGKVIAVASGKGGVGKSTVAVNLALALQKLDYRVGLLDIDIYGPSLPTLLGLDERPGVRERRIVPLNKDGLRVMSLGFLMEEDTPVIWRGPIVTGIIRQFLRDVDWSGIDYLIVDMPPGTGDAQLALAQTVPVDGAIVVTTPSELALIDAARGLQMFKTLNVDVLGVISNMSKFVAPDGSEHFIFGQGTVEREVERLETQLIGEVPLDTKVREGGDNGRPIVLSEPDSPTTQVFIDIAKRLVEIRPLGEGDEAPKKKGLFSFLKG
jgi:ATP-binding protein involved in chromosome partitioning